MLKAKDFRFYAREALKGRWLEAGGASLVAGLLGASIGHRISSSNFNTGLGDMTGITESGLADIAAETSAVLITVLMGVALVVLVWGIVVTIIGGATTIGYAKYSLNLVDDKNPKMGDVVSEYDRLGTGFFMQFLRGLFTLLWSLLFVIPGIIAAYSYFMTPFILAENPEMGAQDAIKASKELMKGNKWRLFCLQLSFLGWQILAVIGGSLIMGIVAVPFMLLLMPLNEIEGIVIVALIIAVIAYMVVIMLTLAPYIQTATAVFYREIKDGKYSNPQIEGIAEEYSEQPAEEYSYEPVEETEPRIEEKNFWESE